MLHASHEFVPIAVTGQGANFQRGPLRCVAFTARPEEVLHLDRRCDSDIAGAGCRGRKNKHLAELRKHCAAMFTKRLMKNRSSEACVIDKRLLNVASGPLLSCERLNPVGSGGIKTEHDCTPFKK